MIFIINNEGTTTSAIYEPVYQGSNNANRIVLLAPFASTSQVTVSFKLPNGQVSGPHVMSLLKGFDQAVLDVLAEGKSLNAWYISIDSIITQYAGVVDVQFALYTGNETVQNTYPSTFEIIAGTPIELPQAPTQDVYAQILDYLSTLSAGLDGKAIDYIRYKAPSDCLLNGPNSTGVSVSAVPEGLLLMYSSDFTVSGMTSHLDEANLKNPGILENYENMFFQIMPRQPLDSGFIVDLGAVKSVGVVQPYIYSISHNATIELYTSTDGEQYMLRDSVDISKTNDPNALSILQLRARTEARYVKIVEKTESYLGSNLAFKGIEIYSQNVAGRYEIKQNNGATNYIRNIF